MNPLKGVAVPPKSGLHVINKKDETLRVCNYLINEPDLLTHLVDSDCTTLYKRPLYIDDISIDIVVRAVFAHDLHILERGFTCDFLLADTHGRKWVHFHCLYTIHYVIFVSSQFLLTISLSSISAMIRIETP